MEISLNQKVDEYKSNFKGASDFFCRFPGSEDGELYTLKELALLNGVSPELMIKLLLCFETDDEVYFVDADAFKMFTIDEVLVYLYKTHHFYKDYRFPKIERLLFNCMKPQHTDKHFFALLNDFYIQFKNSFLKHMALEEEVLFTYADVLIKNAGLAQKFSYFNSKIPETFLNSHENETDQAIFFISSKIAPHFYNMHNTENLIALDLELKKFRKDLEVHAWVEEELLVPKMISCRDTLFKS